MVNVGTTNEKQCSSSCAKLAQACTCSFQEYIIHNVYIHGENFLTVLLYYGYSAIAIFRDCMAEYK